MTAFDRGQGLLSEFAPAFWHLHVLPPRASGNIPTLLAAAPSLTVIPNQSFVERLRNHRTLKPSDPWTGALRNIRGQIGYDRVERIATDAVFEQLDLPPLQRTSEAAKRLKLLMVDLGWTPVRSRHVTSRGRAARVRRYARIRLSVEPNPCTIEP